MYCTIFAIYKKAITHVNFDDGGDKVVKNVYLAATKAPFNNIFSARHIKVRTRMIRYLTSQSSY